MRRELVRQRLREVLVACVLAAALPTTVFAQAKPPIADSSSESTELSAERAGELLNVVFNSDVDAARALLAKYPLATSVLPNGEPVVLLVTRYGGADLLALFAETGADLNAKGPGGWTPLFTAIAANRPEIVQLLLDRGIDPTQKAEDGTSALDLATAAGDTKTLQALQDAMPGHVSDEDRQALYLQAAAAGDPDIVFRILKRLDNVDAVDEQGWTGLMYATAGGHVETVSLLLQERAAVNHIARNGVTALMVAAMVGNRRIVDMLLAAGAGQSLRDDAGQTAGAIALANGAEEIAKALGAKPSAASLHQRVAAAAARKDRDELKRLLDSGAPAAKPSDATGETPAIVAAACAGDSPSIKLLIERGAKIEETDRSGVTPLIAAALCNQVDATRILVDLKASAQAKTKDGIDALTAAMSRGNNDIVTMISVTASPTMETALQFLQRKDLKTLAALLKANPDLGSKADADGPMLLRHAILLGDPTVLEAVVAMTSYNVNALMAFPRKSALAYAIEANRIQSIRTLVKLGAAPTQILLDSASTTPLEIALKRGATEALQVMSQAARREILAVQSVLVTFGLLTSAPDGSWGPGTQAAWDKAKKYVAHRSGSQAEDALTQVAKNYLRVCNQTGEQIFLALHARSKSSDGSELDAWFKVENGQCRELLKIRSDVTYSVGASRTLAGARSKFCTKQEIMDEEGTANIQPPCRKPYSETSFVEVTDLSKPFVARYQ